MRATAKSETYRASRRGRMLSMRSAVSRHYSPLGKIKRKKARRPQHVRVRWLPPSDQRVMLSAARPAAAPTGIELTMRRHSRQAVVHHRLRVAIRQRSESPFANVPSRQHFERKASHRRSSSRVPPQGRAGMRRQWSITVACIEIPSNDPAALVIGGVGDVGLPILQRG